MRRTRLNTYPNPVATAQVFDRDSGGTLDKAELTFYLGKTQADLLMPMLDNIQKDGEIDRMEWTAYFERVEADMGEASVVPVMYRTRASVFLNSQRSTPPCARATAYPSITWHGWSKW